MKEKLKRLLKHLNKLDIALEVNSDPDLYNQKNYLLFDFEIDEDTINYSYIYLGETKSKGKITEETYEELLEDNTPEKCSWKELFLIYGIK